MQLTEQIQALQKAADRVVISNATGNEKLFLDAVSALLAEVRAITQIEAAANVGGKELTFQVPVNATEAWIDAVVSADQPHLATNCRVFAEFCNEVDRWHKAMLKVQGTPTTTSAAAIQPTQDEREAFEQWKGYALPELNAEGRFDADWLNREFISFKAGMSRLLSSASKDAQGAVADIAAERARQMSVEGWAPEHDDEHDDRSLAQAAACYVQHYISRQWVYAEGDKAAYQNEQAPYEWPDNWCTTWWKPKNPRRDLVRAAALIAAEIDRIDRAAMQCQQAGEKA
jgi:hypothetical protein